MNPIKITIQSIWITQKDYRFTTEEDYGNGFFVPISITGRYIYAQKAKQQPITGQIVYCCDMAQTATCELSQDAIVADKAHLMWASDSFLQFWYAGDVVGLDVGLNRAFARQAEDFNKLKDINAC